MRAFVFLTTLLISMSLFAQPSVSPGVDIFFSKGHVQVLKSKRIALVTNQTALDRNLVPSIDRFLSSGNDFKLVALFAPEHGIDGKGYAWEKIANSTVNKIPVFSLHGKTRRPTEEMLSGIDVIIYDIQEVGARPYTYLTTLCYVMEEAAKKNIEVIVLDRPNPINGVVVDGPMLEEKWRSFIGYLNVPYCHGMTIGELALFFNGEYKIGCALKVVPMEGWKRSMSFQETGLAWIPPSPYIPEADTPYFYPMTGILGELKIANIGIGYTLPFKVVGAPWINSEEFASKLNGQNLPGVKFLPFHFRPFYGLYEKTDCQGVYIVVTDRKAYRPIAVQYLILGLLKSLYPQEFLKRINCSKNSLDLFCKANGTEEVYTILKNEKYPAWKLIEFQKKEREAFLEVRKKYLLVDYPE